LDRLVIGDIETLDLVAEFGPESFDVVVFGDVLEHLRNPVPVLRQTRDLLAAGGFVVISIPNIAHGDVRLALLQGRWDYRPLGLLDETHLRFFTWEGVERMLWEAGFASVEMRRTSTELFETELGVRPEEFDAAVVEQIRRDPESTTYQFVLKAVPADADTAIHELREREEAQRLRIVSLEREVAERARQVEDLEGELSQLLEREGEVRERLTQAEAELRAVYATRTMRLARVPRAIYARLRSKRSGERRRSA
ncbi:MAG: methyltransferase domain-containing protein, partial [Actinomycetota bacterium]|nr:methyltransferase domain-containing protein [Actinomycetota bacterium]